MKLGELIKHLEKYGEYTSQMRAITMEMNSPDTTEERIAELEAEFNRVKELLETLLETEL